MNKENKPSIPAELKAKIEAQLGEDGGFDRGVVWSLVPKSLLMGMVQKAVSGRDENHFHLQDMAGDAFLKFRAKTTKHRSAESVLIEIGRVVKDVVIEKQRALGAAKRGGGEAVFSVEAMVHMNPNHPPKSHTYPNTKQIETRRELSNLRDRVSKKGWSTADEKIFAEHLLEGVDDAYRFMITLLAWGDVERVAGWVTPELWERHQTAHYVPCMEAFEHLTENRCSQIFEQLIQSRSLNPAAMATFGDFIEEAYRRMRVALIASWEVRDRSYEKHFAVEPMVERMLDYRRMLARLAEEMPESHKVITLRWEIGFNDSEISRTMNLSTYKVRIAYEKGVKRIAKYLDLDSNDFLARLEEAK